MIELNTWNISHNMAYIIGLIMFKQIDLLHNLYEGYDARVQRISNMECWALTLEDRLLVSRFSDKGTYSSRIEIFDAALMELKSRVQKKNFDINVYYSLLTRFVKDAVKYRQPMKLRWNNLNVRVIPKGATCLGPFAMRVTCYVMYRCLLTMK